MRKAYTPISTLLEGTYSSIPEKVQRLKHIMAQHLLHIAPENTSARPTPKTKKLSEE